jgi:hypothetical protein
MMCGAQGPTTILHHIRCGNSGMGRKPPDWYGVALCFVCHSYAHGEGINDHKAMLMAYQRQIDRWLADGLLTFTA